MAPRTRSDETRTRILDSAAEAFRRRGYAATGIDAVMAGAGLTHGGFYAHFSSKAELAAATIAHGSGRNELFLTVAHLRGRELIESAIDVYLSRWHREHPECGCTIPTLGAELPRLDAGLGAAMGGPVRTLSGLLAENLPPPAETATARARALLALLVGGVVTARTLPDDAADAWLASCREAARRIAGLP